MYQYTIGKGNFLNTHLPSDASWKNRCLQVAMSSLHRYVIMDIYAVMFKQKQTL